MNARNIILESRNEGTDVVTNAGNGSMRVPLQGRRRFSRCTGCESEISDLFLIKVADLA